VYRGRLRGTDNGRQHADGWFAMGAATVGLSRSSLARRLAEVGGFAAIETACHVTHPLDLGCGLFHVKHAVLPR